MPERGRRDGKEMSAVEGAGEAEQGRMNGGEGGNDEKKFEEERGTGDIYATTKRRGTRAARFARSGGAKLSRANTPTQITIIIIEYL